MKFFLEVTPERSRITLGKSKKLSPIFCGPFDIVTRIGKHALDPNWCCMSFPR